MLFPPRQGRLHPCRTDIFQSCRRCPKAVIFQLVAEKHIHRCVKKSASSIIVLNSGWDSRASHLYTAPTVTPSTSASCSCVNARCFLNVRIFSASLFSICSAFLLFSAAFSHCTLKSRRQAFVLPFSLPNYSKKERCTEHTARTVWILIYLPLVWVDEVPANEVLM